MLKSLQILRFVAATSVVYYHITFSFGSFGVDIFFVLSGFVIALVISKYQSPNLFAISRVSRIIPIYWILTTLLLMVILVAPNLIEETLIPSANFWNYLRSLLFIPFYNGEEVKPLLQLGWTLNYEMFFYLLVWISLILTRYSLIFVSTLLIFLFLIFAFVIQASIASSFLGNDIILEFILGIIAFKIYSSSIMKNMSLFVLSFLIIVCFCLMIYFQINDLVTSRLFFYGLPSFLIVLCSVGLENYLTRVRTNIISFFVSMGDASYSTYLSHWYVVVASRKIFSEKLEIYNFHSPIGIFFTLIISLIVGQIIYKLADNPMNFALKKYLSNKLIKN